LSIPIKLSSGDYYVYVHHSVSPFDGASFSIGLNNETAVWSGPFSDKALNLRLNSSGWVPGTQYDQALSSIQSPFGAQVIWQLSNRINETARYIYYDISSLNLKKSNFCELQVFGDENGSSIGSYFYDSQNHWVHFSFPKDRDINSVGWHQVIFNLSEFDSTSGDFDWSNVTRITFEYSPAEGQSVSNRIAFTPYAFYTIEENDSQFVWSKFGPFHLSDNEEEIILSTNSSLALDSLMIADVSNMENIGNLLFSASSVPNTTRLTQTEFSVPLQENKYDVLILKQSYHPLWKASINNNQLQHFIVNFGLYGFLIKNETQGKVSVWFEGDRLLSIGIYLSTFSLVTIVSITLAMAIKNKRKLKLLG
jgi:hypothetical protein